MLILHCCSLNIKDVTSHFVHRFTDVSCTATIFLFTSHGLKMLGSCSTSLWQHLQVVAPYVELLLLDLPGLVQI